MVLYSNSKALPRHKESQEGYVFITFIAVVWIKAIISAGK